MIIMKQYYYLLNIANNITISLIKLCYIYIYIYILGWIKSFAIFWDMLFCDVYITWLKQLKLLRVTLVADSIVISGALTLFILFRFVYDLKAAQMNVEHSFIGELMLSEFKLGEMWRHSYSQYTNRIIQDISLGLKASFSIATTPRCKGRRYFIPWIVPLP